MSKALPRGHTPEGGIRFTAREYASSGVSHLEEMAACGKRAYVGDQERHPRCAARGHGAWGPQGPRGRGGRHLQRCCRHDHTSYARGRIGHCRIPDEPSLSRAPSAPLLGPSLPLWHLTVVAAVTARPPVHVRSRPWPASHTRQASPWPLRAIARCRPTPTAPGAETEQSAAPVPALDVGDNGGVARARGDVGELPCGWRGIG
jgi:hypothetical protein